ncbi:hypothetical protein BIFCAT_00407 [Bifidobacterium catenulatum DSM 16992 = JCM 1194 = LMG 11043]|uniref:Uncharacterized protein n=1 Tax=Bifidobacterium catenulatum DSM 16992 = JCM 1194 = LMG 11043 TaxID=566552 RepID=B6XT96_9BIFI|nr:hypothetical protein BIFCAT_00407 [Bifidobacterium catenulatum DSM 16992 = JCM 1194 = LMG 11043]
MRIIEILEYGILHFYFMSNTACSVWVEHGLWDAAPLCVAFGFIARV